MPNTVSVTAGSPIVTGDVTSFVGAAGDLFILNGLACPIISVDSTSHLTLQFPWPGATQAGQTRWLLRNDGPYWSSTVTLNQQLAAIIPTIEAIADGTLAADGAVPMTGNLRMGGHRVTGLAAPVDDADALSRAAGDERYTARLGFMPLDSAGGTMSGDLNMGSHRVTGLGAPVLDTDALSRAAGDVRYTARLGFMPLDSAGGMMSGDLQVSKATPAIGLFSTVNGNYLIRVPDNNKLQISNGVGTFEIAAFGADGSLSLGQIGDVSTRIDQRAADFSGGVKNYADATFVRQTRLKSFASLQLNNGWNYAYDGWVVAGLYRNSSTGLTDFFGIRAQQYLINDQWYTQGVTP